MLAQASPSHHELTSAEIWKAGARPSKMGRFTGRSEQTRATIRQMTNAAGPSSPTSQASGVVASVESGPARRSIQPARRDAARGRMQARPNHTRAARLPLSPQSRISSLTRGLPAVAMTASPYPTPPAQMTR